MTRPLISSRLRWLVVIPSLVTVDFAFTMSPAAAACHAFTVSASPTTVNEGGRITVTVTRDANVNPSAVDVRTVDGSARSGADFAGGRRTISFTVENQRSYTIPTLNDTAREGAETFRIELVPDSGSGCTVQPNFTYGPPVTVTIRASDAPPATASPRTSPPPPTRRATAATTAPAESASPRPRLTTGPTATATGQSLATTAPPVASLSASPTATASPVATTDSEDDDAPIGLIIGALALAAGVGTAAVYFLRQRRLSG